MDCLRLLHVSATQSERLTLQIDGAERKNRHVANHILPSQLESVLRIREDSQRSKAPLPAAETLQLFLDAGHLGLWEMKGP
jgi:hypothetical protein